MDRRNRIGNAASILLVEDETFVREVTREILESAGYRVICARTAGEASVTLCEHSSEIDLLVTDIILPDGSGRALAARILQMDPCFRILYVSGYPEQIRELETSGEACLAKPYASDLLLETVKAALEPERIARRRLVTPACAVA